MTRTDVNPGMKPDEGPQQRLLRLARQAIHDQLFPGAQIGFIRDGYTQVLTVGRLTYEPDAPVVTENTLYDVASVTKSVPTSSIILKLAEEGQLRLDDPLIDYVPEIQAKGREAVRLRHLLTFTVAFQLPSRMAEIATKTPGRVLPAIFESPLMFPVGTQYSYSNAASTLLGLVAERVCGQPLDEIAHDRFFGSMGMEHTTFRPEGWPLDAVAPTEINHRGLVHGKVHDEGAWAIREQGGIPGHAGLFSTATDLLKFEQCLLNDAGEHSGRRYFTTDTIKLMYENQIPGLNQPAGMGWQLRWPQELGLPGSKHKFGKTGFTGTMIAMDPIAKLGIAFLTNRTYPKRGTNWPGDYADLWVELMRAAWS